MSVFPNVKIRVPATSANLGPGFDSLGLALGLYNELALEIAPEDSLSVEGEGKNELREHSNTIAHLAAHRVFQSLEIEVRGVHLTLTNRIPLARGLGSSSAAIVGGLFAANEWARKVHNRALSSWELLDLATNIEGHPDNVAPALLGGLVVSAMGEGGKVRSVKVPIGKMPDFAVWIPEARLETKTARGVLPGSYSRADAIFNLSRSALLVGALTVGDFVALREALHDKIHQDYRAPLIPGFRAIADAARKQGALGVTLSGAGPSILFWFSEIHLNTLEPIERAAYHAGIPGIILELPVDNRGCHLV